MGTFFSVIVLGEIPKSHQNRTCDMRFLTSLCNTKHHGASETLYMVWQGVKEEDPGWLHSVNTSFFYQNTVLLE